MVKKCIEAKYDIGDKPFSKFFNDYVEIKETIVSIKKDKYSITYLTTNDGLLCECDLTDSKPLLDEQEKKFLRPLVNSLKITHIRKHYYLSDDVEWLDYKVNGYWYSLPNFKKGTMYARFDIGKEYTIKDLDL